MKAQKLTLSIEPDVIVKAKEYAKVQHTSLSKLVQKYLNDISAPKDKDQLLKKLSEKEIPDYLQSLSGILKGKYPDDYDFREVKYEYLKEKHDL